MVVTINEFERELGNFLKNYRVTFKGGNNLMDVYGKAVIHFKSGTCHCIESRFQKRITDLCDK